MPLFAELLDAPLRFLSSIPELAAYMLRRFVTLDLSIT
jgi:hypothetical protein